MMQVVMKHLISCENAHLGTAEEQVTLPVVFDLSNGSLVPVHHDRLHDEILQFDGL